LVWWNFITNQSRIQKVNSIKNLILKKLELEACAKKKKGGGASQVLSENKGYISRKKHLSKSM
jgi:hypothetical protein